MGKSVDQVEQKLLKVVPKEFKVDAHHWLTLSAFIPVWLENPVVVFALSKIFANIKRKHIYKR